MPSPPKKRRRARSLDARVAISLAATGLSCTPSGGAPTPPAATVVLPPIVPEAPPSAGAAAPPAPAVAEVMARLGEQVVLHDKAGRRTLYTWTTAAQIDELAAQRVLLTRAESPVHGASFSDQVLAAYAAGGDKLAALLRTAAFAKARFAWPSPWATLLGWPGESYGDRLIEVELRPEAWIVRLIQSRRSLDVIDLEGRPVPREEVLRHPERIAAVYFVHDIADPGAWGTLAGPTTRPAYREYVLCNESMIARWAVGTPAIARVVAESVSLIEALSTTLDPAPAPTRELAKWNAYAATSWSGATPLDTPAGAYAATLAFPNALYWPAKDALAALVARLRALPAQGPAIEHRPTVTFSKPAAMQPLPPPTIKKPPHRGTY